MVLVAAAFVAGCGSGGGSGLTQGQRQALVAQLEAVRTTAASGDVSATKVAVRKFRTSVARLGRAGALSEAAARELRLGALRLLARLERDQAAAQPAVTTPSPAPAPAPPPAGPPGKAKGHHKHGGPKDKGPKGKGHHKGEH